MLGPLGILPLSEWILIPLIGALYGAFVIWDHARRPVLTIWLAGMIFFGSRLIIELGTELGRPDRVFAAMLLWTIFLLATAMMRHLMIRMYHLQ